MWVFKAVKLNWRAGIKNDLVRETSGYAAEARVYRVIRWEKVPVEAPRGETETDGRFVEDGGIRDFADEYIPPFGMHTNSTRNS